MTDTPKSAWNLEIDIEKGQIRRTRNYSRDGGVPALPLEKKLQEVFMFLAGIAEMTGDGFSSNVIEQKSVELAYGWARVAQENEKVRLVLKWIVETNAWTDAIAPTILVTGAIAWHHDLLPERIGAPIAKFAGAVPVTPEEEEAMKRQAEQLHDMMASDTGSGPAPEPAPQEEPEAEAPHPTTDGNGPSVVPLPPDVPLSDD